TATTTTTNSKAATSTDDAELAQHVAKTASATCAVNEDDADADNSSIRTYIVSSSFTTSSSTPYAVSSTDTAELLRQQNNLSLTEDEQTISSFSIEQPTSSMTIDMAEPQQQTATTTTRSEVTSSSDVLGRGATNNTTTTTTTTTSSSIEEEIEEALELSEGVEEQLRSNLDSTTDAKSSQAPREQSAKADSSEDAAQFRIDDAELSGGQLAQHFLVADDSDEEDEQEDEQQTLSEDDDDDDDDFDISLPLEGAKPVHSRHEESEEQPQGEESLSNQSTTDDVSDFVDEPQLVSSSAQLEQDHSLEEIVATNESIELSYEPEEHTISSTQQAEQLTDLDAVATPLTGSLQPLKLPQLQQPQLMEAKSARALETLQLQPERLELTMLDIADDSEEEECALQLMKLRLLALQQSQSQSQSQLELSGKASPTESPAPQVNLSGELKQMERVPMSEFSKDVLEDITEESERLLSLSTNAEEQQSLSIEESKTLLAAGKLASSSSVISLNMLQQLETQVQQLQQQLETKDNCLASLNLQLESARRETSTGPGSARDSSSLQTNSTEYRTLQEEYGAQTLDIYVELSRRDDMIAKLTESLQQSLGVREQLQTDAERLGGELQAMRRQLAEAMHKMKGSSDWEAQAGARLSEISMDLISESEDELAPHLPNDDDEHDLGVQPLPPEWPPAFSKQIEQFQKCLLPGELRPFLLSQQLGGDSSSECSEAEQLPLELPSKDSTPRKRKRAELMLSPSHRQLTPSGVDASKQCKDELEIAELKIFYQTHIHELKRGHEEQLRKLTERLRFYERRQVEDEDFVSTPTKLPPTCAEAATPAAAAGNTSLIIIDEDELNPNNESQVIQRIIAEYERRLQEQLALARQDIDTELEQQIQICYSPQYAQLEAQLSEVNQKLAESNAKRDTFEVELKTSIDKIFMLREIISELETQVQTKSLNEQVLTEKSKQLEDYVQLQIRSNDALQQEVHSLKTDIGEGYQARIRQLEEKLQLERPSAEQSIVLTQLAEQLRDIETTLEQKTKTLESLHNSNTASNSCSLSATEDVSVHTKQPNMPRSAGGTPSPHHHSLTVEGVQRVSEKLDKHTRVEEAAIKRVRDLEMQVMQMRAGCVELQHERDSLQGRIDEQTERISTLQSRLEEQRQRAEQLHRAGTSDLNSRNHELQNELRNLSEQLAARDKQMAMLQQQLQRSKDEITRLEAELGQRSQPDRSLVQRLEAELQQLKEKMRNETVQRLAMPDLMETMLADKNDEIDHLQQQLEAKERELQAAKEQISPKQDVSGKHSGRTLSDIGSITEFPEPEVDRRAVQRSPSATLQLPDNAGGFLHQTMETSKEAVANLTYKRTDDLSGFVLAHPVNTFEHPHYFQDQHALGVTAQSSGNLTPGLVPRHINFSNLTEDSKLKTPCMLQQTPELPKALTPMPELLQLQQQLNDLEQQKQQQRTQLERNVAELKEQLQQQQQSEQQYKQRISALESKLLETAALEASERENLRRELNVVSAAHDQYVQQQQQTAAARQQQIETLTAELRSKTEQLQTVERELERLKHSEQSSRLYSVDEIAQQVEKELNYSAQLDSNIRKAIESEEENNLDHKLQQKEVQTDDEQVARTGHGTDDENFTGERELLNQLEALRAQLAVQREQCETMAQELHGEKLHSQDIQEQDVLIIEAMRKRLETVLDTEDELHKQLDMERERCERLQTQLTSLQRAESRRNSSMLKSPVDSPRKSPRADFESELSERLRSELKLLTAQNERERERSADAQRNSERERQRYEKELQERVAYCERLKQEMDKLARDKESAELELEHFNERLTLQANEIESLESRMVAMQEAETRRASTRTRQHQEQAKLQAELLELQSKLLAAESAKETLEQKIAQLRYDVTRSAQRETKLTEALAQANDRLAHSTEDTVPAQFLQKMKDINALLAENTQENRQMAETVQYLVGERIALQKKCEELGSNGVGELEERCRQLLGRYLRVESHRKALVYQKRYLKLTLESYQASEQLALQTLAGSQLPASQQQQRTKKKLFK
ncbi:cp309, partial [Drosophila busckii]